MALSYARFEPGNGELVLGNAGLPDPYLLRPGEPPAAPSVPGSRLPLGLRREQDYRTLRVALRPADRLLMLTDGLPEARTAAYEPLGYEGLTALFPPSNATPGAWLDDLLRNLRAPPLPARSTMTGPPGRLAHLRHHHLAGAGVHGIDAGVEGRVWD